MEGFLNELIPALIVAALSFVAKELRGIRQELAKYQTVSSCDDRHGESCRRLEALEIKVNNLEKK